MMMLALLLPLALLGVLLGMERVERWVSNDLARVHERAAGNDPRPHTSDTPELVTPRS